MTKIEKKCKERLLNTFIEESLNKVQSENKHLVLSNGIEYTWIGMMQQFLRKEGLALNFVDRDDVFDQIKEYMLEDVNFELK